MKMPKNRLRQEFIYLFGMTKRNQNAADQVPSLNATVGTCQKITWISILLKGKILVAIIVHAHNSDLFLQDQKSVECIGYREEKTLRFYPGEPRASASTLMKNTM